ncbi:hypothetical protein [Streptomyces lavendofoliae]|uniref:Uncharacterized protein n=1 Tax=Streptomyces lavendofoliae TaxID=67314 RepID=A0A918I3X6_9ACTN|nr:hypothetical protein [Streptomyces lavendofoliae]GGU62684.1 hypothetical protein GCM10010274_59370 [Streptomyces lavendofoliae]
MTGPGRRAPSARRLAVPLDELSAAILRRYRRDGSDADTIRRALRLLAQADGHLTPAGRLITDRAQGRHP